MPYSRQSYFNPSSRYRKAWILTPQGRVLSLSGHKTQSMYDTVSFAIPIFYILFFAAIGFDIYLGFSILAKSGVSLGLIIGSVILDIILAITPFLFATFNSSFNHPNIENEIFKAKLECMTKLNGESDEEFESRAGQIKDGRLATLRKNKQKIKFVRFITITLIWLIAGWKIYTYYSVLPPGFNIWSLANGKIVIIFSFLCAICHIIGSEKAVAHFVFWCIKGGEFKRYNELNNGQKPIKETLPLDYKGNYKEASHENTSIKIDENGEAKIEYIHIIWEDEISQLIQRQGDENAKRGVAIVCKANQII